MFSQLSLIKLRLHTVTRLFWRNSAICNFTKKSDRQQSTSSIKGYTVFLSSFVSSFKEKEKTEGRKHTTLWVIKVIGCCVLLVSVVFFFFFLLQKEKRKGEAKENTTQTNTAARRQHLTLQQKSSCVCTCTVQRELITLSSRSLHGVGGKAAKSWN